MSARPDPLQRDVVYPLALGHMVHDIFSSFLSPFLPLLIAKFSLSMTLAGALSMVFRLTAVGNPLLGVLTDRLDLRPWLALSPVVTAACMCLLGARVEFRHGLRAGACGRGQRLGHSCGGPGVRGSVFGRAGGVWHERVDGGRRAGPHPRSPGRRGSGGGGGVRRRCSGHGGGRCRVPVSVGRVAPPARPAPRGFPDARLVGDGAPAAAHAPHGRRVARPAPWSPWW